MNEIISKQAFICEGCSTIYPVDILFQFNTNIDYPVDHVYGDGVIYKYCPTCKRKKRHYSVDGNIADIIRMFNLIGYRTIYSCEGHVSQILNKRSKDYGKWHIATSPYVMIKGKKKMTKKLFNMLSKTEFNDFCTGQGHANKEVHFYDPKEAEEQLLNASVFTVYLNMVWFKSYRADSKEEAEKFLSKCRSQLLDVLNKYYDDMIKRRNNL